MSRHTDPAMAALQDALAAEHAAVFVYGVLGAQTSQSASPALYARVDDAYVTHRTRRDQLIARIREHGADPVASEAAYQLPSDLSTTERIAAAALKLERGCAATYAYTTARTSDGDRRWAAQALSDAAVRGLAFGGRPQQLPGL